LGKSNILDALCFVLGRLSSKGLRTERPSHLVYNGGKYKKPANKAEVSIVFDNSDKTFPTEEDYVKVTRIVNAQGQSVYKINDEKRTRTQILELLSLVKIDPDGHNIVLQGDIIQFVEMTAEERRMMMEDVAGIGIYEDRKKKALAELGRVGERLKEVDILLAERKTHLKELRKDRDQAMKYKDMSDKIRQYKATYLDHRVKGVEKKKQELENAIVDQEKSISDLKGEIDKLKKLVAGKKEEISKISHQIEEEGEQEQVELNRTIEQVRVDIATTTNRLGIIEGEIVKVQQRREQLEKDLGDTKEKITSLEEQKENLVSQKEERLSMIRHMEEQIANIQKNANLQDIGKIEQDIDKLEKEAEDKQAGIQKLTERK
jgi:chromosome segregation protein